METVEDSIEQQAIGPALPPTGAKNPELFDECHVEYDIVNGIPCYKPKHVVDGQVQIFERIGFDDSVGGTFLGLSSDDKELVVRVAPADTMTHVVRAEAAFLCKVEADNDWRLFSQVHKIFVTDDGFHLTLYFRGGPTLEQCFSIRNKFTFGTAGRLANDVLNIIRCAHKHGYLLRNVNLDCFHYDAASRHLFQADISSLVKNVTDSDGNLLATYNGSLDYAPLVHHQGEKVGARHDLQSWFYMMLHLVLGELPWGSASRTEAGELKAELLENKTFKDLPKQFHTIADVVFSDAPNVTEEEYVELSKLTKQIYEELGGITDYEENMDFEREPTADEIPRFVLEKIPETPEEEEGGPEN